MEILTYKGRRKESAEMTGTFTYQSPKDSGRTAKKWVGKLTPQEMKEAEFSKLS